MHNKDDYATCHVINNHDFQLKTIKPPAPIFNLNIFKLLTAESAMTISKILIFKENTSFWMSFTITKYI